MATELEGSRADIQSLRAALVVKWNAQGESACKLLNRETQRRFAGYRSILADTKLKAAAHLRQRHPPEVKVLLVDFLRLINSFQAEMRSLAYPPVDCLIRDFKARAAKATRA